MDLTLRLLLANFKDFSCLKELTAFTFLIIQKPINVSFFFPNFLEWLLTVARVEDPEDEAKIFSVMRGTIWEMNIGQPVPNMNLHPKIVI